MVRKSSIRNIFKGALLALALIVYFFLVCPVLSLYRVFILKKEAASKTSKSSVILYFSSVQWFEVWQRPQHCVEGLKDSFSVFYISPLPIHHIMEDVKGWLKKRIYIHSKDLVVYSPILFSGENRSHIIRIVNRILTIGYMTELLLRFKITNPILWMNNPFFAYVLNKFPYRFVVYDIMDEYTKFSIAPKDVVDLENNLLEKAKVVFTGTNSLYHEKKKKHDNITFVQCGVDFDMFNDASEREESTPIVDALNIEHPVIGYIGGLNERIDSELIEYIAEKRKNWNILLVGPVQRSFHLSKEHKNIICTGLKPYDQLPHYMSIFDVAILPYRMSGATFFINPVKLLEYMAAGKPVVSVPIPDIIEFYDKYIEIVDDHESFVEALSRVIEKPDHEKLSAGLELAKTKSWNSMVNIMLEKVSKEIKLSNKASIKR